MPKPPSPIAIFAVLGFLNEYAGRRVVQDGDLVESFYANETSQAKRFKQYLKRLIDEYHLDTTLRSEIVEQCIFFHSLELTRLIDAYYLEHGLTGTIPDGTSAYTEGAGFFRNHAGHISAAVFPAEDREARLSYLVGAHERYGEQNSFRFANAFHKVQLVQQLLYDVGCPKVVIVYPNPDRIPAIYRIAFEPTSELITRLKLRLYGYK
jgi:hypothetical protein